MHAGSLLSVIPIIRLKLEMWQDYSKLIMLKGHI